MNNFSEGELNISLFEENGVKIIKWEGISKHVNPIGVIYPYFKKVLAELSENDNLIIDFSSLELMNSSTVPVIIKLTKDLNDRNIKTVIQYDKSANWQILCFKALRAIITRMKNIELRSDV
jgi:hypothetical protein